MCACVCCAWENGNGIIIFCWDRRQTRFVLYYHWREDKKVKLESTSMSICDKWMYPRDKWVGLGNPNVYTGFRTNFTWIIWSPPVTHLEGEVFHLSSLGGCSLWSEVVDARATKNGEGVGLVLTMCEANSFSHTTLPPSCLIRTFFKAVGCLVRLAQLLLILWRQVSNQNFLSCRAWSSFSMLFFLFCYEFSRLSWLS